MQSLTLDQVEKAFQDWRQGRSHKREAIPQKLWDMALQLTPHYQRSHICLRLKLSGHQFKCKCGLRDKNKPHNPGFVVATTFDKPTQTLPSYVTLTIQGKSRKLLMNVPSVELSQVLPHLAPLLL